VDASQTGGGDVSSPQVIGQGGWQQFLFLFSGAPGVIYAAEKALDSRDHYEIGASLTIVPVVCVDERAAVDQANQNLDSAQGTLQELEAEAEHATGQQKLELLAEVRQAKKDVAAAQQALDAAEADLQACLSRNLPAVPSQHAARHQQGPDLL
jgi:seryl-tRNA synthetase